MKKLLACLAVSLSAISAQAQTATVELSSVEGLNGRPGATGYLVKWTTPMVKDVDWDFQLLSSQSDRTNSVSTRAEIGLVPRYDLGWARFSTKVAVGKRMNSTGESNYYSMEPALTVPLNQSFSVRAGYRFREAFESSVADTTKTARLGLNYHLSTKDTVTLRYDRQRGDSEQNSWNLAYTRRF
jgi:hypothetical protein